MHGVCPFRTKWREMLDINILLPILRMHASNLEHQATSVCGNVLIEHVYTYQRDYLDPKKKD